MNSRTTSSIQTTSTSQGPLDSDLLSLKTTNPQIFPSLHPMGGLYRNQTASTPSTTIRRPVEAQEPIKKIKTNNHGQKIVMIAQNNTGKIDVKEEEKELSRQDSFGVPKLPQRLQGSKKTSVQQTGDDIFVQKLKNFQSVGGPSCIPAELFTQGFQPLQQKQFGLINQNSFVPKMEVPMMKGQRSSLGNLEMDPLMLYAIYQKLNQEFCKFQMTQSLLNMFGYNQ